MASEQVSPRVRVLRVVKEPLPLLGEKHHSYHRRLVQVRCLRRRYYMCYPMARRLVLAVDRVAAQGQMAAGKQVRVRVQTVPGRQAVA